MDDIKALAKLIKQSESIVFFGGAGVSTESGVKDYRSENGLYQTVSEYGIPPERILSRSFFYESPEVFYDFYRKYFLEEVFPNDAHKALAELEQSGKLKAVITQNIDGLHQKAGSQKVIELHGTSSRFSCVKCHKEGEAVEQIKAGKVPKCSFCGSILKPHVVLYEEPLYDGVAEEAVSYLSNSDLLIVGGTSLAVYPAASFLNYFRGNHIVMINQTETHFDSSANLMIKEKIGTVFRTVMELL